MRTVKTWAAAAAMLALAGTAQASPMTLVDGGLGVLDSGTNLEWTANMNLGGLMSWAAANTWIATLNTSNYAGHNDWRLPTLNPSDTSCSDNFNPGGGFSQQYLGFHCTGGELSNLFVTDLGNNAREPVLNQAGDTAEQIANLALFSNVQSYYYWSGTEYAPSPFDAWSFTTSYGIQSLDAKYNGLYAVAVRPGDVAASVPEPQTLALALLALGATVVARRRRPA
jgi:hypothetical protein